MNPPIYVDSDNPEKLLARSKVEHRGLYIEQLEKKLPDGEHHSFVQLVKNA